jgi:glycine C-acetyltransferase
MSPSNQNFYSRLDSDLAASRSEGLFKNERQLSSRQGILVQDETGRTLINMCANNYLALSGQDDLVKVAQAALQEHGYGLSSVRFICGTQTLHKQLEDAVSAFLGQEDTILYAAAFDANGGLFEPLLGEHDVIISDALNHASIIDGIRLCKAQRKRYDHNDMASLEQALQSSQQARNRMIVTDGVFSMDGTIAQLDKICALADQYDALVMIDECHASGFMGKTGRGTHEHHGVMGRIDIITGTFGKALGGAMGGFTSGKRSLVETLRQKSRPYLFSNSLAPVIAATSLHVLQTLSANSSLRDQLESNTAYFRQQIASLGFTIKTGVHPIVPVMLFDAQIAQRFATRMNELGVWVTGFFYPVVPMGQARVRVQISAGHTPEILDRALQAFAQAGRELQLID